MSATDDKLSSAYLRIAREEAASRCAEAETSGGGADDKGEPRDA